MNGFVLFVLSQVQQRRFPKGSHIASQLRTHTCKERSMRHSLFIDGCYLTSRINPCNPS